MARLLSHYTWRRPHMGVLFGAFCILAILLSLSAWQYHRATYKYALQERYESHRHSPPLSLSELAQKTDRADYPLALSGHFDNAHTFLLDNQFFDHRLGYQVITPFIISDANTPDTQAILINRGWIPAAANRQILPTIPATEGSQQVIGFVIFPEKKPLLLGAWSETEASTQHWPMRIEALLLPELQKKLPYTIQDFVLQLKDDQAGGFERHWQVINTKGYVHIGYAVQWLLIALAWIIVFIIAHTRKNNHA